MHFAEAFRKCSPCMDGTLIIIGGHEDKTDKRRILKEVVAAAGGTDARLVVLSAASSQPEESGAVYRRIFSELGARDVSVLPINERKEADDESAAACVRSASGVFFTGGDQLRITGLLGGTALDAALRRGFSEGLVIAGTSAGASVMSSTMIVEGHGDDSPKRNTVNMSPGMGFLRQVVVDQHFAQRGRINRLLTAVAQNPHMLGVGIDEDTAIVASGGRFHVIGSQTVTIADGRHLGFSNASESSQDQPLALTDVRLHVLPASYGFDMETRQPLPPSA